MKLLLATSCSFLPFSACSLDATPLQSAFECHLSVLFKGESVIFAIFSCNFTNSKCSQVILKYGDRNMG